MGSDWPLMVIIRLFTWFQSSPLPRKDNESVEGELPKSFEGAHGFVEAAHSCWHSVRFHRGGMFIFEQSCTATDIHAKLAGLSLNGIPSLFRLLRSDKSKILML